ncbi:MAG: endonuclease/exonuclease/phosphatase family protein [Polyangiaceae bacterium]|nr:endonuclease/exonuclease/phosphatase family protein [Polyangiaceae bacterium]
MRVRIATWNIHKGIGGVDRRYRPERVLELLSLVNPDIAMLQEVARDLPRSRFDDQVALLSDGLGMPHTAYAAEHRFRVGGYGNAILSRWPLTDSFRLDLTVGSRKKRGALLARSHVRLGRHARAVVLYNLHLGLSMSERTLQITRFLAAHPFAGLHHRTPVVLGGDFNDVFGRLGHNHLLPAGFRRAGGRANTFPAWLPMRPLDALYVRGDVHVTRCVPIRHPVARRASDHLPLVCELELGLETDGTTLERAVRADSPRALGRRN